MKIFPQNSEMRKEMGEDMLERIRKPVFIIPLPKEETDISLGEI